MVHIHRHSLVSPGAEPGFSFIDARYYTIFPIRMRHKAIFMHSEDVACYVPYGTRTPNGGRSHSITRPSGIVTFAFTGSVLAFTMNR